MAPEPFPPVAAVRQLPSRVEFIGEHRPPVVAFIVAQVIAGRALEIILSKIRVRRRGARDELIGVDV